MYNSQPFDPAKLSRYSVIRVYYEYHDEPPGEKLFVVLDPAYEHDGQLAVICLKATSQVYRYLNDKGQLAGCVFFKANEVPQFNQDTAVQPGNPQTFSHERLEQFGNDGKFRLEGQLPEDFHEKLVTAIKKCEEISPKVQKLLLSMIGEKI